MNINITNLANYIGKSRSAIYHMKKVSPKQFDLLWAGWIEYCKKKD